MKLKTFKTILCLAVETKIFLLEALKDSRIPFDLGSAKKNDIFHPLFRSALFVGAFNNKRTYHWNIIVKSLQTLLKLETGNLELFRKNYSLLKQN